LHNIAAFSGVCMTEVVYPRKYGNRHQNLAEMYLLSMIFVNDAETMRAAQKTSTPH